MHHFWFVYFWSLLFHSLLCMCVHAQSCPTLCEPIDYSLPGSCPWNHPGMSTRVDGHFLLQGIFPTQELNPSLLSLLHWQVILYPRTTWKACSLLDVVSFVQSVYCEWMWVMHRKALWDEAGNISGQAFNRCPTALSMPLNYNSVIFEEENLGERFNFVSCLYRLATRTQTSGWVEKWALCRRDLSEPWRKIGRQWINKPNRDLDIGPPHSISQSSDVG